MKQLFEKLYLNFILSSCKLSVFPDLEITKLVLVFKMINLSIVSLDIIAPRPPTHSPQLFTFQFFKILISKSFFF